MKGKHSSRGGQKVCLCLFPRDISIPPNICWRGGTGIDGSRATVRFREGYAARLEGGFWPDTPTRVIRMSDCSRLEAHLR
jgi:hypothetical protein